MGSLRLLLLLLLGLALTACPQVAPATSGVQEPPAERPILAVLVRDFEALEPSHHDYLKAPPSGGVTLLVLENIFALAAVQQIRTSWGSQLVLQFSDVTLAHPRLSPTAAWVFGPNRSSGDETVDAVLFRGFSNAPSAATFAELLLALAPRWPLPWELCVPEISSEAGRGTDLVAFNPDSGAKLGLFSEGEGAAVSWTVDHVSFLSTRLVLADWWAQKDYGDCVPVGSMTVDGQFRPGEE